MTTPIHTAVPVPVPAQQRPDFWLVITPRQQCSVTSQYGWMTDLYRVESDALEYAAEYPGSLVFKLDGTEAAP